MSEWKWIDRREREPERGDRVVLLFDDGSTSTSFWIRETAATHWMPIPPPPPKMVTIEISEKAARHFTDVYWYQGISENFELSAACRKALDGKR